MPQDLQFGRPRKGLRFGIEPQLDDPIAEDGLKQESQSIRIPSDIGPVEYGSEDSAKALAPIWGMKPQDIEDIFLNENKPLQNDFSRDYDVAELNRRLESERQFGDYSDYSEKERKRMYDLESQFGPDPEIRRRRELQERMSRTMRQP